MRFLLELRTQRRNQFDLADDDHLGLAGLQVRRGGQGARQRACLERQVEQESKSPLHRIWASSRLIRSAITGTSYVSFGIASSISRLGGRSVAGRASNWSCSGKPVFASFSLYEPM